MKMEVRIRIRPFSAIILASTVRPRPDSPRVNDRKIGVFPIGIDDRKQRADNQKSVLCEIAQRARIMVPFTLAPIRAPVRVSLKCG